MKLSTWMRKHHYTDEQLATKAKVSRITIINARTVGVRFADVVMRISKATKGEVSYEELIKKPTKGAR